jgi:hypothetical protein
MDAVSSDEIDWCRGDVRGIAPPVDGCRVEVGGIVPPLYAFMDII